MDKQTDGRRVGGWMDGRMDGWMGGWMDGWMGEWRDGWVYEYLIHVVAHERTRPARC